MMGQASYDRGTHQHSSELGLGAGCSNHSHTLELDRGRARMQHPPAHAKARKGGRLSQTWGLAPIGMSAILVLGASLVEGFGVVPY